MIKLYRIDLKKHGNTAFSGRGSFLFGGRWSHSYIPIVYTSESLALASLEKFVNLRHRDYAMSKVELIYTVAIASDSVSLEDISNKRLPKGWDGIPVISFTKDFGTMWFQEKRSALLKIRSAVVSSEFNYLINPEHPDFKKIKISKSVKFNFDPRMMLS